MELDSEFRFEWWLSHRQGSSPGGTLAGTCVPMAQVHMRLDTASLLVDRTLPHSLALSGWGGTGPTSGYGNRFCETYQFPLSEAQAL